MALSPKQIREGLEYAKKCFKECSHPVVFYNCDDVGYPSGWVETWACLVCGLYDYHSTGGGQGHCCGEFGNQKFMKARVIIWVDDWFCRYYSKYPYRSFDSLFEEIRNSLKEGRNRIIHICEGKKIKEFIINKKMTASELESLFSKIRRFL